MEDNTHHIREQLPGQKDSIDLLAGENSNFLAICGEYDACVDALRYWSGSEAPEAGDRVSEYRNLIRDLYEEITQILAKNTRRGQE